MSAVGPALGSISKGSAVGVSPALPGPVVPGPGGVVLSSGNRSEVGPAPGVEAADGWPGVAAAVAS